MADYLADRKFTDLVHTEIALKEIYPQLGWQECPQSGELRDTLDLHLGIDYIVRDQSGHQHTVQERFRDYKYHNFTDFTLRYRRDSNPLPSRHESEFYKIKADFMVYGIINSSKCQVLEHAPGISFLKYAIVNLRAFYQYIADGQIILDPDLPRSRFIDGKFYAAVNQNSDQSSSFVAFDIPMLYAMFGEDIIVAQKGYF